jgi:small subunit ribosomal protein S4
VTKVIKAKYKLSRKLGTAIWDSSKDTFQKRNYRPGQHGPTNKNKLSDYGLHLQAKQRLKAHYGCGRITERQFHNLFVLAQKKSGNTEDNFIGLLETRLDVIVYRLNIAPTIGAARQLVRHGHIRVNGKKVDISSYRAKVSDIITVKDTAQNIPIILESIASKKSIPDYLKFDAEKMEGSIARLPTVDEVPLPFEPHLQRVVELYSK